MKIEDYGLIGDTQTAALVGRNGSIDSLCLPRFDSGACFAALLGKEEHGFWRIAPAAGGMAARRRYREGTLVLESEFDTDGGCVRITDCMPPRQIDPDVVRLVEGVQGEVRMRMRLVIRFDYGSIEPWLQQGSGSILAVGGPDALTLWSDIKLDIHGSEVTADFTAGRPADSFSADVASFASTARGTCRCGSGDS